MNIEQLRKVFNSHDPVGLIKLGCPDDEYDPEITEVLKLITNVTDEKEIYIILEEVFKQYFQSTHYDVAALKKISSEINLCRVRE